ncbi:alpha/beta fold hydrolase [Streptomyces sp. NPDC013157]|uniref:alpha/beta fold hydrolase n=1 Tax=Streptomyces sp. NPDC013157 TaxID=3364861 RepID=UPI0036A7808C
MFEAPGAAFRRGVVSAGEFALDYAEAGPGSPRGTIVSLPGSAGLEMSTAKDLLAEEYRIIEINPPGFGGKTDLNRVMAQSELGKLLAEAATTLVDGPFVVLGTSIGGINALYLAAQEKERVLGVVLEASMGPSTPEDLTAPPVTPDADAKDLPVPPTHPKKPWADADYIATQIADRMALFQWVSPDFAAATAVAAVRDHATPVLALLGEHDEFLRPSQEKTFREILPHADFRLLPEGTHDLQNTVPDMFVTLVRSFVSELGVRPGASNAG